jgi:hypothetical protein
VSFSFGYFPFGQAKGKYARASGAETSGSVNKNARSEGAETSASETGTISIKLIFITQSKKH